VSLDALGWNGFFAEQFAPFRAQGLFAGRVALEYQHIYAILADDREALAKVAGGVRHRAGSRRDYPVVGDWVAFSPVPGARHDRIHAVLPRVSRVSRKVAGETTREQVLAANIDTIFIAQGLDGDFNLRRLERYLVMVVESGARPVVVLNKADLCNDVAARVAEAAGVAAGVAIHATSALAGRGLDALQPYLQPGQTVAVLGSSGVGKSTLINQLAGEDLQPTATVLPDGRGRHTTRHRQLLVLPGGALIIDSPGLRELQLWDVGDSLGAVFTEVARFAAGCRFRNCQHETEPGCAVRQAVSDGRFPADRLESYMKLKAEARALEERQDKAEEAAAKRRVRSVMRSYRRYMPRS